MSDDRDWWGRETLDKAQRLVVNQLRRLAIVRARAYKSVFYQGGAAIGRDAEHVLADLRKFARLTGDGSGTMTGIFVRDTQGRIDALQMARYEGRREAYRWILEHLNLDEAAAQDFVEVSEP